MGRDGHVQDLRELWPVIAVEEAEKEGNKQAICSGRDKNLN